MLNKIRTSIIVLLLILNLIFITSIFLLVSFNEDQIDYKYNIDKLNYHTGFVNNYNISNLYYKNEGNEKYLNQKIFLDYSVYFGAILTINSLSLFLWILLFGSFCVGESECDCNCDCGSTCRDGSCNCSNCSTNGNDAGKAALVCLVFICLILIIYYSLKCCGKHLSRYISIICYIFNNFCIFILSLLMIRGANNEIFLILIISCISLIANLLALVLPNFERCKRLRFRSRISSSQVINYNINQNQMSQINNNNAMINNNMNNFNDVPIQANYVVNPNMYKTNEGPVAGSQNNSENQNIGRNLSVNQNDSNSQLFEDNNNDLGGAPLPANEMQVKN